MCTLCLLTELLLMFVLTSRISDVFHMQVVCMLAEKRQELGPEKNALPRRRGEKKVAGVARSQSAAGAGWRALAFSRHPAS